MMFEPAAGGRIVVQLDEETTRAVAESWRGRASPARFVLFTTEGLLKAAAVDSWQEAVNLAREEALVIYNARSKKSSRVVWRVPFGQRTSTNSDFEAVRLVPHRKTLEQFYPNRKGARLFENEASFKDH